MSQVLASLSALLAVDTVAAMTEVVPTLAAAARDDKIAAAPDRAKLYAFRETLCSQQTALEVVVRLCFCNLFCLWLNPLHGDRQAGTQSNAAHCMSQTRLIASLFPRSRGSVIRAP